MENRNIQVLTAADVARILRVGQAKAYALLKAGEIKSVRVRGRLIRTTVKAVEEYIESNIQ